MNKYCKYACCSIWLTELLECQSQGSPLEQRHLLIMMLDNSCNIIIEALSTGLKYKDKCYQKLVS